MNRPFDNEARQAPAKGDHGERQPCGKEPNKTLFRNTLGVTDWAKKCPDIFGRSSTGAA